MRGAVEENKVLRQPNKSTLSFSIVAIEYNVHKLSEAHLLSRDASVEASVSSSALHNHRNTRWGTQSQISAGEVSETTNVSVIEKLKLAIMASLLLTIFFGYAVREDS